MADVKVNIRQMEPEDISGILEIDRKISGQSRASIYSDQFQLTMRGEIKGSYVAEQDGHVIGFVLSVSYLRPREGHGSLRY